MKQRFNIKAATTTGAKILATIDGRTPLVKITNGERCYLAMTPGSWSMPHLIRASTITRIG